MKKICIFKKNILALSLASSLVLTTGGCSLNDKTDKSEIVQDDNKDNDLNVTASPTVVPTPEKKLDFISTKEELIDRIKNSRYDSLTKDILISMTKYKGFSDKEEDTVFVELCLSVDSGCSVDEQNISLNDAVRDAFSIEKKGDFSTWQYKLDDLKVVNNLDGKINYLPTEICLFEKSKTFGDYTAYQIKGDNDGSLFQGNGDWIYIIENSKGEVVACSNHHTKDFVVVDNEYSLVSFKDLLEGYNFFNKIKDSYSYFELFQDLTVDISKQMDKNSYKDNLLVIDTSLSLSYSTGKLDDYYLLQKECDYLFDEGIQIYKDINNPNAFVQVGKNSVGLSYEDMEHGISMYDDPIIASMNKDKCIMSYQRFLALYDKKDILKVKELKRK